VARRRLNGVRVRPEARQLKAPCVAVALELGLPKRPSLHALPALRILRALRPRRANALLTRYPGRWFTTSYVGCTTSHQVGGPHRRSLLLDRRCRVSPRFKLALISTGTGVVEPITKIIREMQSDVEIVNFVDDSIIPAIARNENRVPANVVERICAYASFAEDVGADAALVTCSSISEVVDVAARRVHIPIFKIDAAMADRAIATGRTIGVLATLATTQKPTERLLMSRAETAEKSIELKSRLCEGAFDARAAGDLGTHDRLIRESLSGLLDECDVVVLAQASMASAIEDEPSKYADRVLTSPAIGVESVLAQMSQKAHMSQKD